MSDPVTEPGITDPILLLSGEPAGPSFTEENLEVALCEYLSSLGQRPHRQVRNAAGVADIVTREAVYEVKLRLARSDYQRAVGQVVLYRQAINPALRAVVVGLRTADELPTELAQQAGVETWFCDDVWKIGQIGQIVCHLPKEYPNCVPTLLRYLRAMVAHVEGIKEPAQ